MTDSPSQAANIWGLTQASKAAGSDLNWLAYKETGLARHITHVLLHGIGSNADSWQAQLDAAKDRADIKVVAWDAPGYRQSPPLPMNAPTAVDYANAMWAWLDSLNVTTPITLVGHSLGCLTAAAATAMRPNAVSRLVLLSPARGYGGVSEQERQEKLQGRLSTMHKLGIEGMAKARSSPLLAPDASQSLRDAACSIMSQLNERGYTQASTMLSTGDIAKDLAHVTCPVVVGVGSLDTITTPASCAEVAAQVGTTLVDLGAVGHLVAMEAPKAVSELVFGANIWGLTPAPSEATAGSDPNWLAESKKLTAGTITVGDLCAEFLAAIGVRAAFGVISIHNMPILDGFHTRRQIRFVSARGEAGACNMADAYARVNQHLGVVVTSTGTGAGNAAGAMVEALTAGTPLLHLTGQIESDYLDKNLGFIHEAKDQLGMLRAVGKASFRISNPDEALDILQRAVTLAFTPPCGPVSVEIAIDVQKQTLPQPSYPEGLQTLLPTPAQPQATQLDALCEALMASKRPLLWLGGGARTAGDAVARLVKLGFGLVTSVQGRGVIPEDHPQTLAAFTLQKAAQDLYAQCDAMLVVGSRLRSNETLSYKLKLPENLYRVDADSMACLEHPYEAKNFICADSLLTLSAIADRLEGKTNIEPTWTAQIQAARQAAEAQVDAGLAAYKTLKDAVNALMQRVTKETGVAPAWCRDITLSNTMWGNRSVYLSHSAQGVHALGGGIGQGLQMAIGAATNGTPAIALCGDGGLMLNVGELACAVQERVPLLVLVMNDRRYGVIKNIQDADYGSRHAYVELHTPDLSQLCAAFGVQHYLLQSPEHTAATLQTAWHSVTQMQRVTMVEVAMQTWGEFAVKFAGPPRKTH